MIVKIVPLKSNNNNNEKASSRKPAQSARVAKYTAARQNSPNEYSGYDTKQSDGEAPVMLELWGMQSTPSLPSLPGPLCPRVVAPDRVLSLYQRDPFII